MSEGEQTIEDSINRVPDKHDSDERKYPEEDIEKEIDKYLDSLPEKPYYTGALEDEKHPTVDPETLDLVKRAGQALINYQKQRAESGDVSEGELAMLRDVEHEMDIEGRTNNYSGGLNISYIPDYRGYPAMSFRLSDLNTDPKFRIQWSIRGMQGVKTGVEGPLSSMRPVDAQWALYSMRDIFKNEVNPNTRIPNQKDDAWFKNWYSIGGREAKTTLPNPNPKPRMENEYTTGSFQKFLPTIVYTF